jgi:LacI family transcriptional regulator
VTLRCRSPACSGEIATTKDVAELAQVGLKAVSRVVSHEGYVSAETAARVEQAIAEIGYRRNDIVRRMRPGQGSTDLGLLLGDLRNPVLRPPRQ